MEPLPRQAALQASVELQDVRRLEPDDPLLEREHRPARSIEDLVDEREDATTTDTNPRQAPSVETLNYR